MSDLLDVSTWPTYDQLPVNDLTGLPNPAPLRVEDRRGKLISVVPVPTDDACIGCIGNSSTGYVRCDHLPNCEDAKFVLATEQAIVEYLTWRMER